MSQSTDGSLKTWTSAGSSLTSSLHGAQLEGLLALLTTVVSHPHGIHRLIHCAGGGCKEEEQEDQHDDEGNGDDAN